MKALLGVMVMVAMAATAMAEEPKMDGMAGSKTSVEKAAATNAVPDISLQDLKKVIDNKSAVLIDCNGSETYAKGHIPGAIDFESAKDNLASKLPDDKSTLVVAYCGNPKCMAYKEGAEAVKKLGYTNVKHFSGGIAGWKEAGEKVEKEATSL